APRRLLIATNQLWTIAGSEVVAIELARHFLGLGYQVDVYTSWAEQPMAGLFEEAIGKPLITDPELVRPFTYDVVYVQHQLLGLFDYAPHDDDRAATRIVIGRLSRRSFLESGGWLHDRVLADHVLANSELTAEHLASVGHGTPTTVFYNAAPASYFAPFQPRPDAPAKILVVTNHRDPALTEAVELLRPSAEVERIGGADRVTLVTPEMIAGADLVVSIGKTIPYAIAGRVPAYVYDRYGGPGYLDPDNVHTAARYNFSGRCRERQLSAREIAAEIMGAYAKGVAFARDTPQSWIDRYWLPRYIPRLTEPALASNEEKRARMAEAPFLAQECMLANYVRQSYVHRQRMAVNIWRLQQRVRELEEPVV
ncbi:MAG: hypothetical protein EOP61_38730, partial [Sphingomonadales bacterium]